MLGDHKSAILLGLAYWYQRRLGVKTFLAWLQKRCVCNDCNNCGYVNQVRLFSLGVTCRIITHALLDGAVIDAMANVDCVLQNLAYCLVQLLDSSNNLFINTAKTLQSFQFMFWLFQTIPIPHLFVNQMFDLPSMYMEILVWLWMLSVTECDKSEENHKLLLSLHLRKNLFAN